MHALAVEPYMAALVELRVASLAAAHVHQRQAGRGPGQRLGRRYGFIDDQHGRGLAAVWRRDHGSLVSAEYPHAGAGVAQIVAPVLLALRLPGPEQAFDALQVGGGLRTVARVLGDMQRQMDDKGRAAAFLAAQRDASAQQRDQPHADRQPETGAAKAARRRALGLGEGLEQAGLVFRADADAVIRHLQPEHVPALGLDAQHDTAASQRAGRELDRVAEQVVEDLAQAHRVADDLERQVRLDVEIERDVAVMCHRPERVADALGERLDLQRRLVEIHATGLDLGQVEDVVDDLQQSPRRVPDRLGEFLLLDRQLGLGQDLDRTDHAVHGRAHLVAHRGQEVGLGLVGALGGELGLLELARALRDHLLEARTVLVELAGDALALCDVVVDRGVMGDLALGVAQRTEDGRDRVFGAVLAPVVELALAGLARAQRVPHLDVALRRRATRADQVGVPVEHLLAAVAAIAHEGLVDVFDRRVEVGDHDRLRALLHHLGQQFEPGLDGLALADIERVGHANRCLALFVEERGDPHHDREAVAIRVNMDGLEGALAAAVDLAQLPGERGMFLGRVDDGDRLALEFLRTVAMLVRELGIDLDEAIGPGAAHRQAELGLLEKLAPVGFCEREVDGVGQVGDGVAFHSEALFGSCAKSCVGCYLNGGDSRVAPTGCVAG